MITPTVESGIFTNIQALFGEPNGNSPFNNFSDVWKTKNHRLEVTPDRATLYIRRPEDDYLQEDDEVKNIGSVSDLPIEFIHEWNFEHGIVTEGSEKLAKPPIGNDPTAHMKDFLHPNG